MLASTEIKQTEEGTVQTDYTKEKARQASETILDIVDLSGIQDWSQDEQQEAKVLIHEYACIFPTWLRTL